MCPHYHENPDPYRDERPPERQPRQGTTRPPAGGNTQGGQPGVQPDRVQGRQPPQGGGWRSQQPPQGMQPPPGGQSSQHHSPQSRMATAGRGSFGQSAPPRRGTRRDPMLRSAPVGEVLQSAVVTVHPETPIPDVAGTMATEDVGSVIVVEERAPVGIVTDRTLALALRERPDLTNVTAGDFVSGGLVTGTTGMTVFDVLRRLEAEGIRRLPIVDDDGTLQGIVTLDDVIVRLNEELASVASVIESQSPHS